jgi:hypothetical protein
MGSPRKMMARPLHGAAQICRLFLVLRSFVAGRFPKGEMGRRRLDSRRPSLRRSIGWRNIG